MTRPVGALFAPASVAVLGASENPSKWGYHLAAGALAGAALRPVHLVNRRGGALDGVSFVPSLAGLDADLAAIAVPAAGFLDAVDEALAAGARALVGVTAGLSRSVLRSVITRVRASGAVLLGPNCMGVTAASTSLRLVWGDLPPGRVGLLSQSGNLAIELGMLARRAGTGFSRFASVGDAADLGPVDLLPAVAEGADAVALYLEDVGDGRAFVAAARDLVSSGVPVSLLTAGRSAAGARAAASHTGGLATDAAVLAAACREAGVMLVSSPTGLIESMQSGHPARRRRSAGAPARRTARRLGIVADGGGHGVVAADLAAAAGLDVTGISAALRARIAALLPPNAGTANPVDLAGGGERDLATYAAVIGAVVGSGEVDAVLLSGYFGGYAPDLGGEWTAREGAVADAIAGHGVADVAVFVHSMAPDSVTSARLRDGGIPVWGAVEHAVAGAAHRGPAPDAAPPWSGPAGSTVDRGDPYFAGRALLAAAGVTFPEARSVAGAAAVAKAAADIGYPVVLKALGPAHKSDVGGVALGLADAAAVEAAYADMTARLAPPGFSVEAMAEFTDGVEMIVGARRDPRFGPVVLVGFGGVLAEVLRDSVVELAPVTHARAVSMLGRLRGAPALRGFRGRPGIDTDALARVIVAVGDVAAAHPEIVELDVNPVLAHPAGALALDAHLERIAVNGGDLVVSELLAHGVDTVFGIPGTHNLEIYRALDGSGIRHVTPRHEQGAGYAADGYARSTGRPGVAVVTTGPALLNIATAVGQAYSDSVPMLVIAPGMPLGHRAGTGLLHETRDQTAALAAVAGRAVRVTSHAEIVTAIAGAFAGFATGRPRPVVVEIPLDLLTTEVPPRDESEISCEGSGRPIVGPPGVPDPALVDRAARMLTAASRPVMIVGGGARHAAAEVRSFAESLRAAVLTTTNGKGILSGDHPLAVTSALHLPAVADLLDAADAVLAVGTDLAPTDFWSGLPDLAGKLVRVDIDPHQITINATPTVAIVADAAPALAAIHRAIDPPARDAADRPARGATDDRPARDADGAQIRAQAAAEGARWTPWLAAIDAVLVGHDGIVAADNAMACYYGALGNLPIRRPGGFLFPTGFGTLGFAVPAGIGAKLGNPYARVVALSGDGGLMFSVAELATAAAERVTLPVVVFDNGGYGEIRAEMRDGGITPLAVDLPGPDFVALATALGGHGERVTTPDELRSALERALERSGPTVIVVPEGRSDVVS